MRFFNLSFSALMVIVSALCLLLLLGCRVSKPTTKLKPELEEGEYIGTVTNQFEQQGCEWLIQFNDGVEDKYLIPIQLEQDFKKNGLKVVFSFHYSRISQGNCQMGQPAVLEDIKQN